MTIYTFKYLFGFLQEYNENSIIPWLEESWRGKDKQESLLRIFAGLDLFDKLKSYHICKGNFNKKTITKHTSIKDVFYTPENNLIALKDIGDKSDLTMIHSENDKKILVTSSKNRENENNEGIGKYDVREIHSIFTSEYNGYELVLCICTRNKEVFMKKVNRCGDCNEDIQKMILRENTIIIDWNDLNQAYHQFKMFYGERRLDDIINLNKKTLILRMAQELCTWKTINSVSKNILWGQSSRIGKTYMIGGVIIMDSKEKDTCNYLIITTAINETASQYHEVFDHMQFIGFNVKTLKQETEKEIKQLIKTNKKNIIIVSDMYIKNTTSQNTEFYDDDEEEDTSKNKIKQIKWLKELNFNYVFLDESHKGGTTTLAQKMMNYYGHQSTNVFITATYSKPINDYNIPKDNWILWDLEDIKFCKNIDKEGSITRLVEKHGECIRNIISKYSLDNIISEYSKYPELWTLTHEIKPDTLTKIINNTRNVENGWSLDACFLLNQSVQKDESSGKNEIVLSDDFQKEKEVLKVFYTFFGKKNEFDIPDDDYPDDIVFMKRIEKICKNPTIKSRFIGEGDFHNEPMIIMAFLPQNNIDKISRATIKLLEKHNVAPEYELISINCKTTNDPKDSIKKARDRARNSNKKGVLVLSGKQCSLGVTIDNCDIVLLLNNNMGYDMIYQMMFRCMTEGKNKKCGFVVDMNIHRAVDTCVNYATLTKNDRHPREATKYILHEKLVNLNGDHWMPSFGNHVSKLTDLCKNVYEIYSSNTERALHHLLSRLSFNGTLTNEEQSLLNATFSKTTSTKIRKELKDELSEEKENIKKGIEKRKVENDGDDTSSSSSTSETSSEDEDEKEGKQINYMDILKHIIPLLCILTIHDIETSFIGMIEYIKRNPYIYKILVLQTRTWWGESIDLEVIKTLLSIYVKYMKDDKETNQIVRTVKELFMKNIGNCKELSLLIDKYFEATELEKKGHAEIPTIFKLRQESLNKVPLDFWKALRKVIEPCCGKGGFIVDIIDRFMKGLKDLIPDEKLRYKMIVEECIYFCDINPTNIFICKLLIDPNNEYNLNYYEGNTMDLDITKTTEHWKGVDQFDLHVCNPPYEDNSSGKRKALNHNLWSEFLNWSYDRLSNDGMLLYITPTSWMSPTSKNKNIFYNNHILYLNINECKKHFNVGSTFSYYVIKKTNIIGETEVVCEYNKKIYKSTCNLNGMEYLPNFTTNETINIIKKFMNNDFPKVSFHTSCELHNTTHKNKLSDDKKEDYVYPVRHTTKRNIRYSKVKHTKHDEKKILLNLSGNLNPIYDNGTMGFTQAQMYLLTDEEEYVTILNSKLYKFVFTICKWSGFNIEKIYHNIPFIKEKQNDDELYKLFKLTEEEINMIESSM